MFLQKNIRANIDHKKSLIPNKVSTVSRCISMYTNKKRTNHTKKQISFDKKCSREYFFWYGSKVL
jgi:hypothetical protein